LKSAIAEGVPGSRREETPGKTLDTLERLSPGWPGNASVSPGRAGGSVYREREVWASLHRLLPPEPGTVYAEVDDCMEYICTVYTIYFELL